MKAAAAFFASAASRQRIAAQPSGRDHRVDRVLLHQHAVGDGDRDRAPRAALADDAGDRRHRQPRHLGLRAGDRPALPVLLGRDARVGARRVDERDHREAEALGDLHHAHRLLVALGIRHAELPVERAPSRRGPSGARSATTVRPSSRAEPRDERAVIGAAAVAVQLDPVVDQPRDVVQRVRPVGMARELDRAPDRLVARVGLQPLQLALEPLALVLDARAAQERQPREARQPLAEVDLLISLASSQQPQQTTREKLPDDFGLAEQNLRFGHLDAIVPRAGAARASGRGS